MANRLHERTTLARKNECPTCGAKPGQACERKRDGYGYRYRANYSHKTRLPGYRWKHCPSCTCGVPA